MDPALELAILRGALALSLLLNYFGWRIFRKVRRHNRMYGR